MITENTGMPKEVPSDLLRNHSNKDINTQSSEKDSKQNGELPSEESRLHLELDNSNVEAASEKTASS